MSQTGLVSWSQTAANNATADSTVNYAEGQAPSSLNDSARAAMASAAKWRDDIAGAIVTAGTSTAYTVTSFQQFSALSVLAGQVIAFTPHTTCGATVTLNVDSLGAKPLRSAPSTELLSGMLIQGTPYLAVYNNSDGAFYLQGFYGNPYNIPLGGMLDFVGSTTPNSSFVFPAGQAISRTTYAALFSLISTTYGTGDGSTTFNVPDLRGRVAAGKDDMGGSAAGVLTAAGNGFGAQGQSPTTLGAKGGTESKTLLTANLPAYTPSGSVSTTVTTAGAISQGFQAGGATQAAVANGNGNVSNNSPSVVTATAASSFSGTAQGGTSTAFPIVQPTFIVNKILRIL